MVHLPPFIEDLGVLLLTGGLVALLFGFLRQPLIVGYLLAGFLIGPNFSGFPHVTEEEGVRLWGEIGVLFLLFSLGLEFSFKKLLRLGSGSVVAASFEVLGLFALGWASARAFGWGTAESLFIGGMISISSTAMLVRALEESGTKSARFASHVYGLLIVEDLYAILLLVILATVSSKQMAAGMGLGGMTGTEALLFTLFKFGFFLIVTFVVGVTILPAMIRKSQRHLSDEMRLILALGLCFITVVIAARVGFSPALGAFIMGSLLAGTREARKIAALLLPVRHLFAAIFFLSVGMQIDPQILVRAPVQFIFLTLLVLIGKPVFVTLGLVLAGRPLRVSIRAGVSMAQIGEFSFIIAALGTKLNLVPKEIGSAIVMVATVTALTTPYVVTHSKKIALKIESWFPFRWREALERYGHALQRTETVGETRQFLRSQLSVLLVNSALIGALGLVFQRIASEFLQRKLGGHFSVPLAGLILASIAAAPFFWGLAKGGLKGPQVRKLWLNDSTRPLLVALMVLRAAVFIALGGYLASRFFPMKIGYLIGGGFVAGAIILLSKNLEQVYERFVQRFLLSLSEAEQAEAARKKHVGSQTTPVPSLGVWDGHIGIFETTLDSPAVGRTLIELQIREKFGATIALIEREDRKIPAPPAIERVYPGDRIHAIGSDEQLAAMREFFEVAPSAEAEEQSEGVFSLEPVQITSRSPFVGLSIRQCGIRERARGLVVGVERGGRRIPNPSADFQILIGDLLWIVGETEKVRALEAPNV